MIGIGEFARHAVLLPVGILVLHDLIAVDEQDVGPAVTIHIGNRHSVADANLRINFNGTKYWFSGKDPWQEEASDGEKAAHAIEPCVGHGESRSGVSVPQYVANSR